MKQLPLNPIDELWNLPPRSERVFTLRIHRNMVITLLVSILLHLSLVWIFAPKLFSMGVPVEHAPPLEITLGPPQKEEVAPSKAEMPTAKVVEQTPNQPKRKPIKSRPPKQKKAPVKVAKNTPLKVPKEKELNTARPQPKPQAATVEPLPGEDMKAYIKRQQEAKLAQQGLSKQDVEAVMASNAPLSYGDKRDAKIKQNLQTKLPSNTLEILWISKQSAQFSFKYWDKDGKGLRKNIFDVSARGGKDIKREVLRGMIAVLRQMYRNGDVTWESSISGKETKLSLRLEDTDALEGFLMAEFPELN